MSEPSVITHHSPARRESFLNPVPQNAPGASAAVGHTLENSIPLSIFPIATDKFCFSFCGLPGRGKTLISRKLARYLSFFHAIPVQVFNTSEYRRKHYGAVHDAEWFDASNEEAKEKRDFCKEELFEDVIRFFEENSNGVAIIDSTNATHEKRANLITRLRITGAKVMFLEITNYNEEHLIDSYRHAIQSNPDYRGVEEGRAEQDYRNRIGKYQRVFETIDSGSYKKIESKWSYLKCDHHNSHFVVHNVGGYLPTKVVQYLMNMKLSYHSFFLSRHGQSEYNAIGRIGGDSGLTQHGVNYAHCLAEFVEKYITKDAATGQQMPCRLWTSSLRRTKETGQFIKQPTIFIQDKHDPNITYEWVQMRPREWHHLDELFAGSCDGMTYEEIEETFPEEFSRRNTDKLAYRYPRGESYLDVIARLEPIILEMERHRERLLVIGHQGILRIIYAYYMGQSRAEAPYVSIPLNTVVELTPSAFDCQEKRHVLYTPQKALPRDGQDEPAKRALMLAGLPIPHNVTLDGAAAGGNSSAATTAAAASVPNSPSIKISSRTLNPDGSIIPTITSINTTNADASVVAGESSAAAGDRRTNVVTINMEIVPDHQFDSDPQSH